jgi:hypothetical protein
MLRRRINLRRTIGLVIFALNTFYFVSRSPAPITIESETAPPAKTGQQKHLPPRIVGSRNDSLNSWEKMLIGTWYIQLPAESSGSGTLTFFGSSRGTFQAKGSFTFTGKVPAVLLKNKSDIGLPQSGTITHIIERKRYMSGGLSDVMTYNGQILDRGKEKTHWAQTHLWIEPELKGANFVRGYLGGQFYWNYGGKSAADPIAEMIFYREPGETPHLVIQPISLYIYASCIPSFRK